MRTLRIKLDDAVPGLRLAKPVIGPTGITVLGAGAELTEALIERLKRIGVPALSVEPDALLANLPTKSLEELEAELQRRFRHANADPTLRSIQEAILRSLRATRWGEHAQ